MVTPEWEEWLARADVPLEDTLDIEDYIEYLREEFGISGGSLDIARLVWGERYEILPKLGIRAVERYYEVRGEGYVETRYAIKEYPGLWGKERMYDIAIEKAEAIEQHEWARWLTLRRERE